MCRLGLALTVALAALAATVARAGATGEGSSTIKKRAPRPSRYSDYVPAEPLVFETESTTEDVILWGKDIPKLDYITVHVNEGPRCVHGGQRWKNISNYTGNVHLCVFGTGGDKVATAVHSLTQQTFRCAHPPADVRGGLVGQPVTLQAGEFVMPSIVKYKLPPPLPQAPMPGAVGVGATGKKKYHLCSCMTMWHRSEFILEWLHYHSFVHGLEKMFIYDNGSEIDHLEDYLNMLSALLPIERVDWPWHPTQLAYMGHCVFKAAQQCSWVMFVDVDEFLFGKTGDGRLDTILRSWKRAQPTVGGLEVQMLAMGPVNATQVIRKPAGGVVRNYQCLWKATNIKTIIRPETVHPSLFGGVHFFCYKEGFIKKTLHSFHNPVIYHYKMQSWEIHMRKYARRASPASKPFLHSNISVNVPSAKWWKEIGFCRKEEPLVFDRMRCALSQKLVPNCTVDEDGTISQLLITGSGGLGSGMGWMWKQLRAAMGTADMAAQTSVDWTSGLIRPLRSSINPSPEVRFRHVFHQVREPIAAIQAATSITNADWRRVNLAMGFDYRRYTDPVKRGLHFWVIYNQLLETVADWTFRVETVAFEEICHRAGLLADCNHKSFEMAPEFPTSPRSTPVTWATLEAVDPNITLIARGMANRYGYGFGEEGY